MIPKNYLKARSETAKAVALDRMTVPPSVTVKNDAGIPRVYIYDEIGMWGVTAAGFMAAFSPYAGPGEVHVHINSPGGDVYDGLAIYHALKYAAATITVHIDGLAASAASFIAMAGNQVVIGRNARMMIHDASTIVYGNAQDMRETADWLDEESDNIADIYAQRAGGDAASWRETMKAEQWYGSAEAIAAGLADAVDEAEAADAGIPAARALLAIETPDGQPPVPESDNPFDFAAIARALKGAFS